MARVVPAEGAILQRIGEQCQREGGRCLTGENRDRRRDADFGRIQRRQADEMDLERPD